jgi:hypothetical protein
VPVFTEEHVTRTNEADCRRKRNTSRRHLQ